MTTIGSTNYFDLRLFNACSMAIFFNLSILPSFLYVGSGSGLKSEMNHCSCVDGQFVGLSPSTIDKCLYDAIRFMIFGIRRYCFRHKLRTTIDQSYQQFAVNYFNLITQSDNVLQFLLRHQSPFISTCLFSLSCLKFSFT